MDSDEVIRALVSVGLVVTMTLGANCQGAAAPVLEKARPALMTIPGELSASHREAVPKAY